MRLTREFLGHAILTPVDDIVAASIGTWTITFTVGKYGIDDGGNILVAWRMVSDWEMPQFDHPKASGYSTVSTSGQAKLMVEVGSKYQRPFRKAVLIRVYDGYLQEGDTITLTMGDTSGGSVGIRAQSYRESKHLFKVLVDPFGTRRFELLPEYPEVKIVHGYINEIQVVQPSYIVQGTPYELVVRALDEWGNPCESYADTIHLTIFQADNTRVGHTITTELIAGGEGYVRVAMPPLEALGTYYIKGESVESGLTCISNGAICTSEASSQLYWGDAHGQTKFTVGTGTLDEYFQFAKGPAALDFTGWQGNDFEITAEKWEKVKERTRHYNQPEKFLTFLGYEWSGVTAGGGDHNIYYLGDDEPVYHSHQWLMDGGTKDNGFDRYPISELWKDFEKRSDVMAIPHIGGRYGNLDFFNPLVTPVIEIHSHHGTFEWFAKEAMKRGLKVGFIATSDDHTCRPGLSYPMQRYGKAKSFDVANGFTAVYADRLTKNEIWQSIKKRHCYATTFARIILDVQACGGMIGDEVTTENAPELHINAVGTAPIDYIEILRGTEVLKRIQPDNTNAGEKTAIKIAWGGVWVKTRNKHADWSGILTIDGGRILEAETFAFDRRDQGITLQTANRLYWDSSTSGDVDGIVVNVDADDDAQIHFHTELLDFTIPIAEITEEVRCFEVGGINLNLELSRVGSDYLSHQDDLNQYTADFSFTDLNPIVNEEQAYWVKVQQKDGHTAWSSPIFITYSK